MSVMIYVCPECGSVYSDNGHGTKQCLECHTKVIPLNISRAEWREKTPLEKEAIRKSIVEDNDSDPNIDQYRAKI